MNSIRSFLIVVFGFSTFAFAVTEGTVKSADGLNIAYKTSGIGSTALVFVHGWTGNASWWDEQQRALETRYQIVQLDLAGHGKSDKNRTSWTAKAYGEDIKAVCRALNLSRIVLIGHSMSGTNIIEAYHLMPERIIGLVPVDTLFDLDEQAKEPETTQFFEMLEKDWVGSLKSFSSHVFTEMTPPNIRKRLEAEMAAADPKIAIPALRTVYTTDVRPLAAKVTIPVRAIQSDLAKTNMSTNQKYFKNYNYLLIEGYGHFPMLEAPIFFNDALEEILTTTLK